MTPEWIETGEEFQRFVFDAHRESINASSVGTGGRGIHVGVFDSVYSLPNKLQLEVDVQHQHRHIETDSDFTLPHGIRVWQLISEFAPEATFSFYQVITDDQKLSISALDSAVSAAIADGVDIVNISAGNPWRGPVKVSPHSREVRRLIDEGITVVAAAGNHVPSSSKPPIHCPAAVEDVIAVGGYVSECSASLTEPFTKHRKGPYYELSNSPDASSKGAPNYLYCGQNGCANDGECITNQIERPWNGNPLETDDKPDVLAPIHYPYQTNDGGFKITQGTSFAAPIVTGSLAEAYGGLKKNRYALPAPYQARETVRKTSTSLDNGQGRKLNGFRLQGWLETTLTASQSII